MSLEKGIIEFDGQNRFLSNFYPCDILFDGTVYPSVEHAYQAAKTWNTDEQDKIRQAKTPAEAKKLGRKVTLRSDWELQKNEFMRIFVTQKFNVEPLRNMLIATGDKELIEGNWWNDIYWGVCKGIGENHLGKILMKVREALLESVK